MKIYINLLVFMLALLANESGYASQSQIASQGETVMTLKAGKLDVHVKIITREIQIDRNSNEHPSTPRLSCTYSKYPCSVVDRIEIITNGKDLFVPRSVFFDLADLNRAEIKNDKNNLLLLLYGGDGAESYIVKIEFDANNVTRRVLSSAMTPNEALEESKYYMREIQ